MAQAKMLKVHLILINFLLFRISLIRCLPPAMCLELYRVNRINLLNLLYMAPEITLLPKNIIAMVRAISGKESQ